MARRRVTGVLIFSIAALFLVVCVAAWFLSQLAAKRDILVKRVREARESQADAQREFKTTLERFREIVAFDGGRLEDTYKKLHGELEDAEDRGRQVRERIEAVRTVSKDLFKEWQGELGQYSEALADRPRWLVLNKLDLLPAAERKKRTAAIVKKLKWKGPVYGISALTADGTKRLVQDVMSYLEGLREPNETAKPSRHGA